jgi:hypothetical protein
VVAVCQRIPAIWTPTATESLAVLDAELPDPAPGEAPPPHFYWECFTCTAPWA